MGSSTQPYQIFQWKYSGVFIAFFWGMAGTMLSIAVTTEQSDLWFALAYLFGVAGAIWSIGSWLTSNLLNKKNPLNWIRQRRSRAKKKDRIIFNVLKWSGTMALIVLLAGFFIITRSMQLQAELTRLHGQLYPANEDIPRNDCGKIIGTDSLLVFLGGVVAVAQVLPATILMINNHNVLTMDRNKDGSLAISLEVRSPDNKIIVLVDRGEFTINKNNYFKMNRKDRSSLEVIDQYGTTVLNAKFFNPRAMWINATLSGATFQGSATGPNAVCTGNPEGNPMMRAEITDKHIHTWFTLGRFPKDDPH